MTEVFEEAKIANIRIKNRLIRSATHEGMADENGHPTERLKRKYVLLAQGEVGAIITGYSGIQPNGKGSNYNMLMIDRDKSIKAYRELVDAIHEHKTPIILQIVHCGRQTRSKMIGMKPVAPSAIRDKFFNEEKPKELSSPEIEEIIDNFVKAIKRAKAAGFDGVQLHCAHGYLLAQFLSPNANRRKDQWGGSTENRFRIIKEIITRAKKVVGNQFPILVKLNAYDGQKNGMNISEAVKIAKMLENTGCAAIEVSCGVFADNLHTARGDRIPFEAAMRFTFKYRSLSKLPKWLQKIAERIANVVIPKPKPLLNYNLDAARTIKNEVKIPVIVVGGINNIDDINSIIKSKAADFVSMSRPFIREPTIVRKMKEGKQKTSKCIYCNYCTLAQEVRPLRCYNGKLPPK